MSDAMPTEAAAGRTVIASSQYHWWSAHMLGFIMAAIRRYGGPELLQAVEDFATTPTGQKVEGYLAAKVEAAGIPAAFVDHAGPEVLALAAKLEAWNATTSSAA